jgi:hypothetical protein
MIYPKMLCLNIQQYLALWMMGLVPIKGHYELLRGRFLNRPMEYWHVLVGYETLSLRGFLCRSDARENMTTKCFFFFFFRSVNELECVFLIKFCVGIVGGQSDCFLQFFWRFSWYGFGFDDSEPGSTSAAVSAVLHLLLLKSLCNMRNSHHRAA